MASFTERMIGAAKLEAATYEEVEHDPTAMGQAMAVVALAAVSAGIGAIGQAGMTGIVVSALAALVGWFVWAGIIFLVGTKLLPEAETSSDMGQLLRTMGFAASPGLLNVLGVIPVLGLLIRLVLTIWQLAAMVVAVRQALDYKTTGKAVVVCLVGWVAYMAIALAFGMIAGAGRMMMS